MQLVTVVEEYVHALIKRAEVESTDGGVVATVLEAPGVVAVGTTRLECILDLYRRLEDWIAISLSRHVLLPVVEGLGLNSERARGLIADHVCESPEGEFFESEQELEAAFARWDAEADAAAQGSTQISCPPMRRQITWRLSERRPVLAGATAALRPSQLPDPHAPRHEFHSER